MSANAAVPNITDKLDNDKVSGVCRSKRKNKGTTNRFWEYGMLMMARQEAPKPPFAMAPCFLPPTT